MSSQKNGRDQHSLFFFFFLHISILCGTNGEKRELVEKMREENIMVLCIINSGVIQKKGDHMTVSAEFTPLTVTIPSVTCGSTWLLFFLRPHSPLQQMSP